MQPNFLFSWPHAKMAVAQADDLVNSMETEVRGGGRKVNTNLLSYNLAPLCNYWQLVAINVNYLCMSYYIHVQGGDREKLLESLRAEEREHPNSYLINDGVILPSETRKVSMVINNYTSVASQVNHRLRSS